MEATIGMICTNMKMVEKAKKVADSQGLAVEIRLGTLEAAIPVGKKLEADGIEVVICRDGTAAILRKHLAIPVISIPLFLTFDLVEDVLEAVKFGKNIGISVYDHAISGMEVLEALLHVKIRQVVYQDSIGLRSGILQAKKAGMNVYLGGSLAVEICREINIPCVMFSSSEESLISAIHEAVGIASIRREEKEKTRRIEAIIGSVSEGMIAVDQRGIVNIFNRFAEDILKVKGIVGAHINSLVPQMGLFEVLKTGLSKLQKLQTIGDVQIIANLVPIHYGDQVIGAIASFTDVSKVIRAEHNVRRSFTKGFVAKYSVTDIVYKSRSMEVLIEQTSRFARSDSTILVTGESGTGKELIAHSIHNLSPRQKGPFVAINCSALPETLLESELFGHEEGAFTGAKRGGKPGLFELAHQGTIFLDEVGSVSEAVQSRLLRVLQQKEVMRIGGDRIIPVDVRIIAATNMDLLRTVKQGRLRMDLYFRLNILRIHIPPLRERKEDIPVLVMNILKKDARKYSKKFVPLTKNLLNKFVAYSWPGNIRELQNFIEKFVLMADTPDQYEQVLSHLFEECRLTEKVLFREDNGSARGSVGEIILEPLCSREEIARGMGISRTTLWRRLKCKSSIS